MGILKTSRTFVSSCCSSAEWVCVRYRRRRRKNRYEAPLVVGGGGALSDSKLYDRDSSYSAPAAGYNAPESSYEAPSYSSYEVKIVNSIYIADSGPYLQINGQLKVTKNIKINRFLCISRLLHMTPQATNLATRPTLAGT